MKNILALFAFFVAPMGFAQTLEELNSVNLEDLMKLNVVSGASKYEQRVTDAPADVTVISAEKIKEGGYRNLYEILNAVRGIYMIDDRNYNFIGIRGFHRPGDYNSRVLVTVDGHRINENLYDSVGFKEDSPVAVDLIERVEVIRGPGSSLYGSNAIFGVINIITKSPTQLKGLRGSVSQGSFGANRSSVTYGAPEGKNQGLLIGFDNLYANGNQREYGTFPKNAKNQDSERLNRTYLSYDFDHFGVRASHYLRYKSTPAGAFGSDYDSNGHTDDERYYLELLYKRKLSESTELTSRTYFDGYRYQALFSYSGVINTDYSLGQWWGQELRLTSDLNQKNKLVTGFEFKNNTTQDQQNFDPSGAPYLVDHRSSTSWALFGQNEWRINENWQLLGGLRYDKISYMADGRFNPRASVICRTSEKNSFKLLYGQAFRAPNQYEMYFTAVSAYQQIGNPDLKPEIISTYELVWDQSLSPHYNLTVSAFYYLVSNLIDMVKVGANDVFQNSASDAVAQGLEYDLQFKMSKNLSGNVALTIQEVTDKDTGRTLSSAPKQVGKLNVAYELSNRMTISSDIQFVSKTQDLLENEVDAYGLLNIGLTGKMTKRLDWTLRVANVLNADYAVPVEDSFPSLPTAAMPQDGTNGEFKLTYRF